MKKLSRLATIALELLQSRLDTWRYGRLRVLFAPKPQWEQRIAGTLRLAGHSVVFAPLTPENVARYDLVVPITIEDVLFLDAHRECLAGQPILFPSRAVVELCDDKIRFHRFMVEHGFGGYVPQMQPDLEPPYMLKKRQDGWGANSHLVLTPADERRLGDLLDDADYLRQQLVPGAREYAAHVLFLNGRIASVVNIEHRFDEEYYVLGKKEPQDSHLTPCWHGALFGDILTAVGYNGLCCIDYKLVEGKPVIFEINPRFGASLKSHFHTLLRHLPRRG